MLVSNHYNWENHAMNYTVKEYQARVNAIFNSSLLVVDGMTGPKTRQGIKDAMQCKSVKNKKDLFHSSGIRGIVWHWTASTYAVNDEVCSHYNDVHDYEGNSYEGGARAEHQVNYDWRRGIGVSHTRNMNTGWIGQSVAAMAGSDGWPMRWGKYPLTWEGIDAMLERSAEYAEAFDIPVTKWTMLSHAEVQPTLNVRQENKWDYMVLPGDSRVSDPVMIGDILRKRLQDKFL